MGALSRVWLAAGLVAALAAVGIVLLGSTSSAPSVTPTSPLAVRTSLSPAAAQFGDPVTARVVVLLDKDAVEPGSLRLVESVAPLTVLGSTRVTRTTRGQLLLVTHEIPATCISDVCLAEQGARRLELPSVQADATRHGGGTAHAEAAWPVLPVGGRVAASDLARANPPFRVDVTPPPPDYRISPSTLALLLDVLAIALAVAGIALAAWEATSRARRRRPAPVDGALTRALRLAREAEARPAPDRRRAVGLLARLVGERDRALGEHARDLAWSRRKPDGGSVSELVDEVERTVGQ